MYLVRAANRSGIDVLVFLKEDPRKDGFEGEVIEGATLEVPEDADRWPDGERRPAHAMGRDGNRYKVFRFAEELREAGYHPVSEPYTIMATWKAFQQRG